MDELLKIVTIVKSYLSSFCYHWKYNIAGHRTINYIRTLLIYGEKKKINIRKHFLMAEMQMQSKYRAILVGWNLVGFFLQTFKEWGSNTESFIYSLQIKACQAVLPLSSGTEEVSKLVASFNFTNWIFSLDQIFRVHTEIIGCLILFLSHIRVYKSVSSWLLSLWLTQYARLSSSFHDRRKGVYFSKGIGD